MGLRDMKDLGLKLASKDMENNGHVWEMCNLDKGIFSEES